MNIHIGERVKKRARELRIGATELATRINTSRQNIAGIYKRASLDSHLLFDLSKALDFNFFSYYDLSSVSGKGGGLKDLEVLRKDFAALQKEMELLKENNKLLKQLLDMKKEEKPKKGIKP